MLTRKNSLERKISEFMELKNTTRELCKANRSFNSPTDQAKERISETEDKLNEIKFLRRQNQREMNKKKQTKPPRNMGLCEEN